MLSRLLPRSLKSFLGVCQTTNTFPSKKFHSASQALLLLLAVIMMLEAIPDAVDLWYRLHGKFNQDKHLHEQQPTRFADRLSEAGYDILMLLVDFVTVNSPRPCTASIF